jgi:hypothetical protein
LNIETLAKRSPFTLGVFASRFLVLGLPNRKHQNIPKKCLQCIPVVLLSFHNHHQLVP